MDTIASFTIDHLRLLEGIYVSRKDKVKDSIITTFDIRMTRPNYEPVINTAEIHTIEHLAATFLRNHKNFKNTTIVITSDHYAMKHNNSYDTLEKNKDKRRNLFLVLDSDSEAQKIEKE